MTTHQLPKLGGAIYSKYGSKARALHLERLQTVRALDNACARLPLRLGIDRIRMLDIGGFDGRLSAMIIRKLWPKSSGFIYIIDVASVPTISSSLPARWDSKILHADAAKWISKLGTQDQFDIILLSHVLYYCVNWRLLLSSLYRHLSPNGFLLIVLRSKKSDAFQIRKHFRCFARAPLAEMLSSEKLMAFIRSEGLEFCSLPFQVSVRFETSAEQWQRHRELCELIRFFGHWTKPIPRGLTERIRRFLKPRIVLDILTVNLYNHLIIINKSNCYATRHNQI